MKGRPAAAAVSYLGDQRFVLLHQLVQVLLVFLEPLEQVQPFMLQQRQLLIGLQGENVV